MAHFLLLPLWSRPAVSPWGLLETWTLGPCARHAEPDLTSEHRQEVLCVRALDKCHAKWLSGGHHMAERGRPSAHPDAGATLGCCLWEIKNTQVPVAGMAIYSRPDSSSARALCRCTPSRPSTTIPPAAAQARQVLTLSQTSHWAPGGPRFSLRGDRGFVSGTKTVWKMRATQTGPGPRSMDGLAHPERCSVGSAEGFLGEPGTTA